MDRTIVYAGAIPLAEDVLRVQRNMVVSVGHIAAAAYGQSEVVANGFAVSPGNGLAYMIDRGSVFYPAVVDQSNYGALTADPATIIQQSILEAPMTLAMIADGKPYVIAVSQLTGDDQPIVLDYFNAANPAQTLAGPNNSNQTQPTRRPVQAVLQLYPFGQVPQFWLPLFDVTVPAGTTQVTMAMIAVEATAPFYFTIPELEAQVEQLQAITGLTRGVLAGLPNNSITTTYTATVACNRRIVAVGAGGSSGTASSQNVAGGAGGAGAVVEVTVRLNVGDTINIQINGPGPSVTGYAKGGLNGGDCTVTLGGLTITAGGGGAGGVSIVSTATSPGGTGGLGSVTGDLSAVIGQPLIYTGGDGPDGPTNFQPAGCGGSGRFGQGGRGGTDYGRDGQGYGAGGASNYPLPGGSPASHGGAGSPGIVFIEAP